MTAETFTANGALPAELLSLEQWVTWRFEVRGGRLTKVPYAAKSGRRASTTDPTTWDTYEAALQAYARRRHTGLGFVFSADDPFVGIDLDHCRDPETGAIEPGAMAIVLGLGSYTEISPSGTGLHIIIKSKLPPGRRRKGPIEMYDRGRFFCMTSCPLEVEL